MRWILFILLLALTSILSAQPGVQRIDAFTILEDSLLLQIVAGDSTVSGNVSIGSARTIDGIVGQIWLDSSTYTTGSFGAEDSVDIDLKSSIGGLSYAVESVANGAVPCTLTVNEWVDSLFCFDLYIEYNWEDSVVVAADSTASAYLHWLLKVVNKR